MYTQLAEIKKSENLINSRVEILSKQTEREATLSVGHALWIIQAGLQFAERVLSGQWPCAHSFSLRLG